MRFKVQNAEAVRIANQVINGKLATVTAGNGFARGSSEVCWWTMCQQGKFADEGVSDF